MTITVSWSLPCSRPQSIPFQQQTDGTCRQKNMTTKVTTMPANLLNRRRPAARKSHVQRKRVTKMEMTTTRTSKLPPRKPKLAPEKANQATVPNRMMTSKPSRRRLPAGPRKPRRLKSTVRTMETTTLQQPNHALRPPKVPRPRPRRMAMLLRRKGLVVPRSNRSTR